MGETHYSNAENSSFNNKNNLFHYKYSKGDDKQKLSVIHSIPELLKTCHSETITKIIPKIQHDLPTSSYEFQLATSNLFRRLMETYVPFDILQPILTGIESKDPIIADAWMNTLLDYIPKLSNITIINQIIPLAKSKSQIDNNVSFRINGCQMLGLISTNPNISPLEVKRDILPMVTGLCQDVSFEVRAVICKQLPHIAKGLGSENVVQSSLLLCLVELCSDEYPLVRASAIDSVVNIIPYLNTDTIKDVIIPLVKQLCMKSTELHDNTFVTIAKVYGKLLHNLQTNFTPEDCLWFLKFYYSLSVIGKPSIATDITDYNDPVLNLTCRQLCAYNLPAVTLFTVTYLDKNLDIWLRTFENLSQDSCYIVRKNVACCLHEVIRVLGKSIHLLKNQIIHLLLDDAEEVLENLIPNLGTILELLYENGLISNDQIVPTGLELGRALTKCQQDIFKKNNWRFKVIFLKELERLPNYFPSTYIHQYFTPVVLNVILKERAKPVRCQAARTILLFLRYNLQEAHRKWTRDNLIQLSIAKSCYTRRIYVDVTIEAMEIFSHKYVKTYFFYPLLILAEDQVSIIRYSFVKAVPQLISIMQMPSDQKLLNSLEGVLRRLNIIEKDRDVLEILNKNLSLFNKSNFKLPSDSTADQRNEKQKIEEEERISRGCNVKMNQKLLKNSSKVTYKIEKGANNTVEQTNDMSFLEQHFYIDAGINLPAIINKNVTNVTNMLENLTVDTESDLEQIESITRNITDDMKVNIQKFRRFKSVESNIDVKKRYKRYSSTLSSQYIKEFNESSINVQKRRSLNISSSDLSKIPVSFKAHNRNITKEKSKSVHELCSLKKTNDELKENAPIKIAKASNLPVFIKRPTNK